MIKDLIRTVTLEPNNNMRKETYNLTQLSDDLLDPVSSIVALSISLEAKLSSNSDQHNEAIQHATSITQKATVLRQTIETLLTDFSLEIEQTPEWLAKIKSINSSLELAIASPTPGNSLKRFKGKCLVVEDEPSNQMNIGKALETIGLEHDFAKDATAALDALENNKYEIIFMDYNMPQMNGIQLTEYIRSSQKEYADIIIIAHTLYNNNKARIECKNAGMNDFLAKPATAQNFEIVVSNYLEKIDDSTSAIAEAIEKNPFGPDFTTLQKIGFTDPEIVKKVNQFSEKIDETISNLETAVANNDYNRIKKISHKLASDVMSFGSITIQQNALDLEQYAKDESQDLCIEKFEKIASQIKNFKAKLDEMIS